MDLTKLTTYSFQVKITVLFSDSSYIDISEYFKKFRISFDYLNHIFPLILLQLSIPPEIILKIQNDKDDVKFEISIDKIRSDDNNTLTEIFFDSFSYIPIKMDDSPLNISSSLLSDNSVSYQYDNFEMILFPEKGLLLNKPIISGIYRNCTILDVLVSLCNKLDTKLNIYQIDNRKTYKQIILRPGNILQNIRHLNNVYGMYTTGSNICYTLDKLNIQPNDIRRYKNINNSIHIYVRFSANEANSNKLIKGIYTDEFGRKIINCQISDIICYNSDKLLKEIMGNKLYEFYSNNEETIGLRTDEFYNKDKEKPKTKVYRNKYDNLLKENEFKENIRNTQMIQMSFNNLDINLEDVNKLFVFHFDNINYTKFDGNYQLCYNLINLDYDNKGYSGLKGSLYLKKLVSNKLD